MKLARIAHGGGISWATPDGNGLLHLIDEAASIAALRGHRAAGTGSPAAALDPRSVTLLPPLLPSANVYCIGLNYKSHVEETARDLPPQPSVFVRVQQSLVGHGQDLERPRASTHFDYEGELAIVIGKPGRHVRAEDALGHVGGLSCFNDGSVRDFQKHSVTAGKNFARSGACGPFVVTADEVPDPATLMLTTRLNGLVVQQSSTGLLIYSIPTIISYLSSFVTLQTGDVIATGTPAGVGARRTPPLWMKPGDRVEVEIEGVGLLSNCVVQEADSAQ